MTAANDNSGQSAREAFREEVLLYLEWTSNQVPGLAENPEWAELMQVWRGMVTNPQDVFE